MSSFDKSPEGSKDLKEDENEVKQEEDGVEVAPFVTKVGSVTVTHQKPSTEPPTDFEFCQPCSSNSVEDVNKQEESDDESDKDDNDDKKVNEMDLPPAQRNITPKDVSQVNDDDEVIYIVGTQGNKVTRLHNIENMTKLKVYIYIYHVIIA